MWKASFVRFSLRSRGDSAEACRTALVGATALLLAVIASGADLPALNASFGAASARTAGDTLIVSTGPFERRWRLTPSGLQTTSVALGERSWSVPAATTAHDWSYAGWLDDADTAEVRALSARRSDDDGFTSPHLAVTAEFHYPRAHATVRYEIWAYPGAAGLRTQLWVRADAAAGPAAPRDPGAGQTDFLPAAGALRAIGYFNDTQHRHEPGLHLVRDEPVPAGEIPWASILCVEDARAGLAIVKESHKCANQPGVDTGAFIAGPGGVRVTGWGLARADVRQDEFRWCWATWTVGYDAPNADARELALKRFDRARYPVRADLDLYLKANTWGSGDTGAESMARAAEAEVLAEIDSVADLGLDTLQIDDGWQSGRMSPPPPADREWIVRPDWYPAGWKNVVAHAAARGVSLGIWHAARAPLAALQRNYATGGFTGWKLDFADLSRYDAVAAYLAKGRAFIAHTGHRVRVNWDVTENAPRFGYFWARECGNIWLANRKPRQPTNVVPQPWLMLRETWELARYLNANKFELPIQNFALVDPQRSDAPLHSTTYATALGLSGIPVFFQTTRLLTPEQRAETKALLAAYRRVRADLFTSYVFPVGDEPTNRTWSGFQWFDPAAPREAYVLVFRERLNEEPTRRIPLRFLPAGATVRINNLRDGVTSTAALDHSAALTVDLPQPGDVFFARLDLR